MSLWPVPINSDAFSALVYSWTISMHQIPYNHSEDLNQIHIYAFICLQMMFSFSLTVSILSCLCAVQGRQQRTTQTNPVSQYQLYYKFTCIFILSDYRISSRVLTSWILVLKDTHGSINMTKSKYDDLYLS